MVLTSLTLKAYLDKLQPSSLGMNNDKVGPRCILNFVLCTLLTRKLNLRGEFDWQYRTREETNKTTVRNVLLVFTPVYPNE